MEEKDATTGPVDESKQNAQKAADTAAAPQGAAAVSLPAVGDAPLKDDIQKILKEAQLPERREVELSGEKKRQAEIKPIDALLASQSSAEAQAPSTPAPPQVPQQPPAQSAQAPATQPAQETPKQGHGKISSLHTLKDDLQGVVRGDKISVVRAVALEQEKRTHTEDPPIERIQSHRLRNTLIVVAFLGALGSAALGGVYYVVQQKAAPTQLSNNDSLIFAESAVGFPLSPDESPQAVKAAIAQARLKQGSLGSVTRIVPLIVAQDASGGATLQRPATFSEFLKATGATPPEELMRALSDDFFLGIHVTVDKNAPLIIVPVTSYEHAFAGMLEWEKTMNGDLAPLFLSVPQFITQNGIPQRRTFSDSVFRNYDVRQLSDDSGAIALYYSFPSRNILIIGESPYTFTEILSRLQAQRAL